MTTMPPIQLLLDEYAQAKASGQDRVLAETAYALAIRTRDDGQFEKAQEYAREALAAAERLPSSTLDDVASTRQAVGGVPLPELFHDGVIRSRLEGLLNEYIP
ncbi:hypothetical protein [Catellatospora tritici]|uniref:hypothetical protein n=1 Tax=Catellatospora tritici TaxID=2851566 RepID=UPI001C2D8401|nr:hypothetical protein [Catellatospora tritici]MBV1854547.1 hypothetical protein [Catellatospora tritici]